jgi:hypothetical protein
MGGSGTRSCYGRPHVPLYHLERRQLPSARMVATAAEAAIADCFLCADGSWVQLNGYYRRCSSSSPEWLRWASR